MNQSFLASLFRKKSLALLERDLAAGMSEGHGPSLKRELTVTDLTAFGIAAVIGAGIFSTIGNASFYGGPAVIFLFMFTAIACGFSAFCYAEFASRIPVAGSAYTYTYATIGELLAWIIGWDLICEYAVGNIAVAISWSDYFTGLLSGYGIHFPNFLSMDYLTAYRGANKVIEFLAANGGTSALSVLQSDPSWSSALSAYNAWSMAPSLPSFLGGMKLICDLPAFSITALITVLIFVGIRESKRTANVMVVLKIAIIFLVIILGAFYVNPANWSPFAPNGVTGIWKGVSGVFFAYIGFDSISTTAEECKNPQRDLPRGMIYSLIICTVLYILVALILTGMTHYSHLQVGDPLAFVFGPQGANLPWISGIVAIGAIIAMTTVLLVFQIGQPRIWMVMGRDGLLPPIFSAISPRFQTPWFSTILTGLLVAIPSLFLNLTEVTDLTSIGTLFAFVLVCAGVLFLPPRTAEQQGRFHVPYVNGKWVVGPLMLLILAAVWWYSPETITNFFRTGPNLPPLYEKIPQLTFIGIAILMSVLSFVKNLSLIPVLGLLSCGHLMTELGYINWLRFGIWMLVGLAIYFLYGRRHSRLNRAA